MRLVDDAPLSGQCEHFIIGASRVDAVLGTRACAVILGPGAELPGHLVGEITGPRAVGVHAELPCLLTVFRCRAGGDVGQARAVDRGQRGVALRRRGDHASVQVVINEQGAEAGQDGGQPHLDGVEQFVRADQRPAPHLRAGPIGG